jgi:hypothetical protein
VAYLILTHKDPQQVEALASRILTLSDTGQVVVHHDLKADPLPWDGSPPARVHLVDRVRVEWGDWSIVEATLRMFRFARDRLDASWFVVLSGEHWPVVNLAAWERTLPSGGVDAYLPAQRLPRRLHFGTRDLDGNRFLARCVHRWFRVHRPKSDLAHRALAGLSKVSLRTHPLLKLEFSLRSESWFIGVPRRRGPVRQWDLYKGSEWLACNANAADILLRTDPRATDWFRHSHIPDESYVQTVVRRSNLTVENADVTWVPPEPGRATPGWMLLKEIDLDTVLTSGVAFARKVDPARNPEVITAIDARVDVQHRGEDAPTIDLVETASEPSPNEL